MASDLVAVPLVGVPWWGIQNLKYVGGRTGFRSPPSLWDIILYGPSNTQLPGLVKVRRCSRRMKLHRKEHPSSDFETQTFQGWSVVEFDFDLLLWTQPQLADLSNALAYLFPGAGDPPDPTSAVSVTVVSSTQNLVNPQGPSSMGTPGTQQIQTQANSPKKPPIPVLISHPALQLHGVSAVVFESMEGPTQVSDQTPDIFKVHFKTVQFRPSSGVQHKTLNQPNTTLTTAIGVTRPDLLPPEQDPTQGPSVSGGADPYGTAQYTNFLLGPVSP
jgi:hypothetical protein